MPKGLAKAKVSMIAPSAEELLAAKTHLRGLSPAQLSSKKASLRQFLNSNQDKGINDKNKNAIEILEKFHVHVMRCKLTEKKFHSSRELTVKRDIVKKLSWYSEEALCYPANFGTSPHPMFF